MASAENSWQEYWGETYGPDLKRWLLKPVFEKLEKEGKIGELIVDVGSGASPVTRLLAKKPTRKRICVDVAAEWGGSGDEQRIRFDVEKIDQPGTLAYRKAVVQVCRFLQIDPRAEASKERADLMIFSDILNYVDFRRVLLGVMGCLKPGGRFIVINLPMRGNRTLFSVNGLKDNTDLFRFLAAYQFEIEHKAFPCRPKRATDEAEELVVLVARRSGGAAVL